MVNQLLIPNHSSISKASHTHKIHSISPINSNNILNILSPIRSLGNLFSQCSQPIPSNLHLEGISLLLCWVRDRWCYAVPRAWQWLLLAPSPVTVVEPASLVLSLHPAICPC